MKKMQYEEASIEIIEFGIAYTTNLGLSNGGKGDNENEQDLGGFFPLTP